MGEVADLIEKEGVFVCICEESRVIFVGTCKSASFVTEELRAHGLRAVHPTRDRGPVRIFFAIPKGAVKAYPRCERGFSRPTLPHDQDGDVEAREASGFVVAFDELCGDELVGVPKDPLLCRRAMSPVLLVDIVEGLKPDGDGFDRDLLLDSVALDDLEGALDKAGFCHEHPDRVHRRRPCARVDHQVGLWVLFADLWDVVPHKLEDGFVIGWIIVVPSAKMDDDFGGSFVDL